MHTSAKASPPCRDFAAQCLSIDLEVGVRDPRIYRFAAVRGDSGESFVFQRGDLSEALSELEGFATGLRFLLGHNLINFDLTHLTAARPFSSLLALPPIDTLWLNPLAFPRNPYHHLVKHYQYGQLKRERRNDPELDARLALEVFHDQYAAFELLNERSPHLLLSFHWLTTLNTASSGFETLFSGIRGRPRPSDNEARISIEKHLISQACLQSAPEGLTKQPTRGWSLAYVLAWISVAGGNSVIPPWVRHEFPEAGRLLKRLRDSACDDPNCAWCRERNDSKHELHRWFGFDSFRPEPAGADGCPLQQVIVEAAMRGEHVLGILPTGTGKSLCYQIPALSRYEKTGALTLVISPLVALMADQVTGLEARGITSCAAINGLLSMPERSDVLERVRLGDIGILIVAPEQLRNRTVRSALAQREIGAVIIDEAHCISKWGHDFRPDYRYVGRFIREHSQRSGTSIPPVMCLTATAKPDVVADICDYFKEKLDVHLNVFDGGAYRTNLDFVVVPTSLLNKLNDVYQVLVAGLPPDLPGGAIVYCATRRQTQEVAEFLAAKGIAAEHFHAGLQPETKKRVQESFIRGDLRVIAATNAFGMGIDKPDVRLVVHADMPGSLENYMQESGRAGRDRESARCVLLYTAEDVERQFGMSARSRLSQREVQAILKSLRKLDWTKRMGGEVIATSGEILSEEDDGDFKRDSATDDTRVRTAIAWLEEADLLRREENRVEVFPSSLRVGSLKEANERLAKTQLPHDYRRQLLSIVSKLIGADPDQGISTDELELGGEQLRRALYDLEHLGIASNDAALTAYVHAGVDRSSNKRLAEAAEIETMLIDQMRLDAPDLTIGERSNLNLRRATQRLRDEGCSNALPEKLRRILRSIANDGRNEGGGKGSLQLRRRDAETLEVTLLRDWQSLARVAELRRTAAAVLLDHFLASLAPGAKGTDLIASTTLGKLRACLDGDLVIRSAGVRDHARLLDRALLWLHEQEVLRLNKGLAVFRPAMTLHLSSNKRGFVKADFQPLQLHYDEQIAQIHVMAEYVARGLRAMAEALNLAMDYFSAPRDDFMRRWMSGREKDIERQTTPASWSKIVETLNREQQKIVTYDRERNVLVLAGPGSGKTRVLTHRIAYLVRVRREDPRRILALAYNRHAAVEIRRRLAALIGDDAKGVTVLTCHALAMRLAGVSFFGRATKADQEAFKEVMLEAVALLKGEGLAQDEADAQRQQLLGGFRWILVDEYQDIGGEQYALISALAGRTLRDEDAKLSLFAVGDDDQNVYEFSGASVEFIRRFETDYSAGTLFLTENYRSTSNIISAANLLIDRAQRRMKSGHSIRIDHARVKGKAGGEWEELDPVGNGRVQILPAGRDWTTQAQVVMTELLRLSKLDPTWTWSSVAVIARKWEYHNAVRSFCELNKIPVQFGDEETPYFWRLRETQQLVDWLRDGRTNGKSDLTDTETILRWLDEKASDAKSNPWWSLIRDAVDAYASETNGAELPVAHFLEWLAEWGREFRRRQTALLLLTAHRAKGLEFDHVAVLDGGWGRGGQNEDPDAQLRLYYVAMTRARKTLTLAMLDDGHSQIRHLPDVPAIIRRSPVDLPAPPPEVSRKYRRLSPAEMDLGFAGRHSARHPIHSAIARMQPGDPIELRQVQDRFYLVNVLGNIIGRLSQASSAPSGMKCIAASVAAIVVRKREDEQDGYKALVNTDKWEIVIPDLVFAPA